MYKAGDMLPGGWQITIKLGEGSYGVVYQAEKLVDGRMEQCAVKHISLPRNQEELRTIEADLASPDPAGVQRYLDDLRDGFVQEYQQMKALAGHANVVTCHDLVVQPKQDGPGYDLYLRMELLTSLSSRIVSGGMNRQETLRMGMDICSALTHLRQHGVVHRDIKPQNIFVSAAGDYKLGDFGAARLLRGMAETMSIKGTPAFMAPEIMLGRPADFTTDVYSLGLVLYRLTNGNKSPFLLPGQASTASSMDAANARRFGGEPLPPPSDADAELARIILRACAYEPRNRWQSADAMRDALAELASGTVVRQTSEAPVYLPPPDLTPDEPERKTRKFTLPRPVLIGVAVAAAAALLLLAGLSLGGNRPAAPLPSPDVTPTLAPATPAPPAAAPLQTGVVSGSYVVDLYPGDECTITAYTGRDEHLTVPDRIEGCQVTAIGNDAFQRSGTIRSVQLPEGLRTLDAYALFNCTALERVTLPSTLSHIAGSPFLACTALQTIEVHPQNPWYYADDGVLLGRDGTLAAYPAGRPADHYAIPAHVTAIAENAFACSQLATVTLPEGLTSIGMSAFQQSRLASVSIPAQVAYIGPGAFSQCKGLCSLTVAQANPHFYASHHVLISRGGALLCYPDGLTADAYVLPASVSSVISYAMANPHLTRLTIPAGVVSLGQNAIFPANDALTLHVARDSAAHRWAVANNIPCIPE